MKKKYQIILPVLLPLALIISVAYMIQGRADKDMEYKSYISAAETYAEKGILSDAVASYQSALKINPSIETYLALGELYLKQEEYRNAFDWYEDELLNLYPQDSRTYEFGIRTLLAQNNAKEAFQVYDLYQRHNLKSEIIEQEMQKIWYSFDLSGEYEEVRGFSNVNEIAAVKMGDTWGYIDTSGSRVIANLYQSVGDFSNLAPVVDQTGEAFFIDTSGDKKLTASYFLDSDPEFGKITKFQNIQSNLVLAYNDEIWNYYDVNNYQKRFGGYFDALPVTNGVGAVSQDGDTWALISENGEKLTEFVYDQVVIDNKEVLCRNNAVIVQKDGEYWLVDKTGQQINGTGYEKACAFNENSLAAVKKEGRWIFVSEAGEEQSIGDFEEAKSFSAGAAAVKKDGKWGYIDMQGEWIIEPQFYDAEAFCSGGCAFVKTEENVWQLLKLYRFHH